MSLTLDLPPHRYSVCRHSPDLPVDPAWFQVEGVVSVTRTKDEISVVLPEDHSPHAERCERGFRVLRVRGPLDFGLVGILANLTGALASAGISVFVLSTFDTDLLLVREEDLDGAVEALTRAGHTVHIMD